MKISNMKYEIISPMSFDDMLRHIENCGRICYKSEGNKTKDSWRTWIIDKIDMGHESLLEHCGFSVKFKTDRGVTHELVRHRIASYSQESTRYCNYATDRFGNSMSVISILNGIKLDTKMKNLDSKSLDLIFQEWYMAMEDAEKHYNKMIELGATPQIARSVLPNSVKTEIMVTANIREWRNILRLRTAKPAHPQIRELLTPLLMDLRTKCPQLFGDIIPYMEEDK